MKTKTFDCVEMKRQGAERVLSEIVGLTMAEELAYWQTGTEALRQKQREALEYDRVPDTRAGIKMPVVSSR